MYFAVEHVHGLLHVFQRLDLVGRHVVHGGVDVAEGAFERVDIHRSAGRLLVNVGGLLAQHFCGGFDHAAGGGVKRVDLVEHQFLVAQRLGDHDGGAQRGNRGGAGAIHAFNQLEIVLANHVQRQITLNGYGKLGEQVLHFLAGVEQQVFLHDARFFRVAGLQLADAGDDFLVNCLADFGVFAQLGHIDP